MKFGGISLPTSVALDRVAGIVADRAARCPIVVVSAIDKTTDRLVAAVEAASSGRLEAATRALASLWSDLQAVAAPVVGDPAELGRLLAQHADELTRVLTQLADAGPSD